MFQSIDAIQAIAAARTDEVVVTTMTSIFQWDEVVGEDPFAIPLIGSMGKASSVALGIAIARPDIRVLCLDGDGSLLMNLGTFASIVASKAKNLVHIVFCNNAYNITGGQPLPAAESLDFAAIAKACGFPNTYTFSDQETFSNAIAAILKEEGPTLIAVRTAPAGHQPKIQHGRMARELKKLTENLAARA